MVEVRQRFDPAAHLSKQGWKGKGSALKHGHSTRPLAVVKKKTLSGIGKDRDEAVPFWDHIFATTAASLQTSSAGSTPIASTCASPAPPSLAPTPSLSISSRKGKEAAKRGLYSRFLKGVTLGPEKVTFDDLTPIGSTSASAVEESGEGQGSAANKSQKRKRDKEAEVGRVDEVESKEDRKARKADKARRKAEKELRRKRKAEKSGRSSKEEAVKGQLKSPGTGKKRKQDKVK